MQSMIVTLTDNIDERNSILQTKTIVNSFATIGAGMIWTISISEYVGVGIREIALLSSLIFFFMMLPMCKGVKEHNTTLANVDPEENEKYTLKDMWKAIVGNDQLMWTTLAMGLFMIGYCTTTGFATYYMQYLYGNIDMYAILAAVCGVAQLAALLIFPLFSKRFNRKQLYTGATVLVIIGYAVFAGYFR